MEAVDKKVFNIAQIIDATTIEVLDLTQFDVDAIMHSGQVFRYFERDGGGYFLVVGKNYAEIFERNGKIVIKSNDSGFFWNYFDLSFDYNEVKNELFRFESIRPAISLGGGIRILRSEFNEMVLSFIISANNNIKRFTKTLNGLSERFGKPLPFGLYSFPTLEELSCVTEADFKALGCGYRAAYLVEAVGQLKEIDALKLAELPSSELDRGLQAIKGVGAKVAACIRLFAGNIHDLSVCPLDTWLKKALTQIPECDHKMLLSHRYAGIAQQYIFYYLQYKRQSI